MKLCRMHFEVSFWLSWQVEVQLLICWCWTWEDWEQGDEGSGGLEKGHQASLRWGGGGRWDRFCEVEWRAQFSLRRGKHQETPFTGLSNRTGQMVTLRRRAALCRCSLWQGHRRGGRPDWFPCQGGSPLRRLERTPCSSSPSCDGNGKRQMSPTAAPNGGSILGRRVTCTPLLLLPPWWPSQTLLNKQDEEKYRKPAGLCQTF